MGSPFPADFTPWWTAGYGTPTCDVRRVVLVVVHSVASAERLYTAVRAIEEVPGLQVVFTRPPGPAEVPIGDFLATIGALTTPWERAVRERFDLVIAAAPAGAGRPNGALLLLPEVSVDGEIVDQHGRCCVTALTRLLDRRSSLTEPTLIGLPHLRAMTRLRAIAPQAGRHAVVVGDPGYDELSDACRNRVRTVGGRKLGLVLSARGPESLLGRSPALLRRLASELPAREVRLVCRLDAEVWTRHGRRQLLAWAGRTVRERVEFLPPGHGWQELAAAADFIVGDHGHDTARAAATGKPLYLANPVPKPVAGSLGEAVADYGTILDPAFPLASQLRWKPRPTARIARRLTSAPGQSTSLLRRHCFRLMRLTGSPAH
ncbi:hypothetical protein SAMN05421837_113212 [Amycolatopsis pretoriensis]|uniref:Uncharacterized protein n=1 Tax=Amycolatopsis pretoriensis TaxID=218821 RepID=A0A1H5RG78_9PSEU|nr:hypothetical protein [Amycolatopsis pretoriensis]SEF37382.1 hypothetical protein SAMN05421837_113212 [Amycolatopsis pretoriensis]